MKATVIQFRLRADRLSVADPENANEQEKFDAWRESRSRSEGKDDPDPDLDRAGAPVDVPAAADPRDRDRPLLRGTAIAGPLRAWLAQHPIRGHDIREQERGARLAFGATEARTPTLADVLMGSTPEELADDSYEVALLPSALRIIATETTGTRSDGRVRVAIDRWRGAAQPNKLFRRGEFQGIETQVTVLVDHAELGEALAARNVPRTVDDVIDALIWALMRWQPVLGGLKSSGSGIATLENLRTRKLDIGRPDELSRLFAAKTTLQYLAAECRKVPVPPAPTWVTAPGDAGTTLECQFELIDALFIDATTDPERENHSISKAVVPATAWRGIFRSRCEFILRTLGVHACNSGQVTCGNCPTCKVFGWASDKPLTEGIWRPDGAASLIRFHDSPLTVPPNPKSAAADGEQRKLDRRTLAHVAIDRFSGGATDSKLYTHEVIAPPAQLTLRITGASPDVPEWTWPLLWLAIADLDAGLIGVGAATTRGCGTLGPIPNTRPHNRFRTWPEELQRLREEFSSSQDPR